MGVLYVGGGWYALLVGLLVNLGLYEYLTIHRAGGYHLPVVSTALGVNLVLVLVYLDRVDLIYAALTLLFFSLALELLAGFKRGATTRESALALWGIIYLGGLGGYLILLRFLPRGILAAGMLLLNVWSCDIAAYFVGTKWGRRRLAPGISPQKSVEGALAGLLGAVLLSVGAVQFFPRQLAPLTAGSALLLGLGVAVAAQLGDLLESALKRQSAVKDSGKLIPGHGGVLDRFDSLLMAAPFAYYFFLIINS